MRSVAPSRSLCLASSRPSRLFSSTLPAFGSPLSLSLSARRSFSSDSSSQMEKDKAEAAEANKSSSAAHGAASRSSAAHWTHLRLPLCFLSLCLCVPVSQESRLVPLVGGGSWSSEHAVVLSRRIRLRDGLREEAAERQSIRQRIRAQTEGQAAAERYTAAELQACIVCHGEMRGGDQGEMPVCSGAAHVLCLYCGL